VYVLLTVAWKLPWGCLTSAEFAGSY